MAEVYFPDCILQNILVRLPTKTLVQFKCVSKHWNSLISDPSFIKSRLRRMILLATNPLQAIDTTLSGDETVHSVINLHSPFGNLEGKRVYGIGAFNGIVLLVIEKDAYQADMILYNPVTGKLKMIPEPRLREADHDQYVYGFGYGTTPDDLKIVRLTANSLYDNSYFRNCDVFSLKNGSWRTSPELSACLYINSKAGTFVNGFLYWTGMDYIVALDVKEMVFTEIEVPSRISVHHLGTFNGRLCLLSIFYNDVASAYMLKVMDEDDCGKHWSEVSSFYGNGFRVTCILDDGKLVMETGPNQIIIYDMLKGSYKEANNVASLDQYGMGNSVEYVESLISPFDMCSI